MAHGCLKVVVPRTLARYATFPIWRWPKKKEKQVAFKVAVASRSDSKSKKNKRTVDSFRGERVKIGPSVARGIE